MTPCLLWLASHFFHPSGQADEARAFLRVLDQARLAPAARHAGRKPQHFADVDLTPEDRVMLKCQLARPIRRPCVVVHHYVPRPERRPRPGLVNVARPMFETEDLPRDWVDILRAWDAVWVTSRHNEEVFLSAGLPAAKLRLLPQTLDFEAFRPDVPPYPLEAPEGSFVFLANFDFSERKGWRQLLDAWERAFHRHDPVCLVVKTGSVVRFDAELVQAELEQRLAGRSTAPVRVITDMLPAAAMPQIYSAADAYVSASRGEAWGRTYMEAMAMGLPTVGTRHGGNLDFMDDENSWLAGGRLVPVDDGSHLVNDLYRGHRWFEADVDELAQAMRRIADDPAAARRKAARARPELVRRFGPRPTLERLLHLAREALEGYPEREYAGRPRTSLRRPSAVAARGGEPSRVAAA